MLFEDFIELHTKSLYEPNTELLIKMVCLGLKRIENVGRIALIRRLIYILYIY
nr:MAG TPA: hypothetical protein [Caudoviricetes sp.]